MRVDLLILGLFVSIHAGAGERTVETKKIEFKVSKQKATQLLSEIQQMAKRPRPLASSVEKSIGGQAADKQDTKPLDVDLEANCYADEREYAQVEKSLLFDFTEALKERNTLKIANLLSNHFQGMKIRQELKLKRNFSGVSEFQSKINRERVPKEKFIEDLQKFFAQYSKIDFTENSTIKYTSLTGQRDVNMEMKEIDIHSRLDLRGMGPQGVRQQDVGLIKIKAQRSGKSWKISSFDIDQWDRLSGSHPYFREITSSSAVDQIPEYQRVEAIRRGGYAIAFGDYDNDGIQDLFVGAYGPGMLLKGLPGGEFKQTQLISQEDTFVKTAIFSDFDNDNDQDLLLVRFVPNLEKHNGLHSNDLVLYVNENGIFKRTFPSQHKTLTNESMPATVADFDGDSLLDFYVGFPGAKDFTTYGYEKISKEIKAQGLFFNKGNMKFSPIFDEAFDENNFKKVSLFQRQYPHSAVAADFDQDGDMDILVVDDRGMISPMYRNKGNGKFEQAAQSIGVMNQGYGMGAAIGDLDNDGLLDISMTNVNFEEKSRFIRSCRQNWDRDPAEDPDDGLRVFKSISKGKYVNADHAFSGLDFPGYGLAGVEYIDYNNDGYLDIYVANGLWSGSSKQQSLGSLYVRSNLNKKASTLQRSLYAANQTQSMVMSVLAGFKGDVESNKWDGKTRPHLAGFQRNRLYRNNQDGSFTEVGYLEGVDSLADGYVISKADIDQDGDLDLVLRNGDPGSSDVNYPAVQIFRNESPEKNNSLRLKLSSKFSNRDAIGAVVSVVTPDGKKQMAQLIANNGTAQSEKIVHFGLGKFSSARELTVQWPNGQSQTFENIKKGYHVIQEGQRSLTSVGQ
jgi:hypothetical protein